MESERDGIETIVLSMVIAGIVIATLANELHSESVRFVGISLGFVVLIAALIYGSWRDRSDNA
jgi:uncharacterized membrane protein